MIDEAVGIVASALADKGIVAYGAALLWGVMSVALSPCHLGSIPLIVGYINKGEISSRKLAVSLSLTFALGLLSTLAVLGAFAALTGRLFGMVGNVPRIVVSVFLVLCGLWLMDLPPLSRISFSLNVKYRMRGLSGALFLGLVYGVILGPCSFAFLAPMIGLAFSAGSADTGFGIMLMAFYAVGHCFVIVLAGVFGDAVNGLLRNGGAGMAASWFKRAMGALVVFAGFVQMVG